MSTTTMCNHPRSTCTIIISIITSIVEYSVDLLWHVQFLSTNNTDHESMPGMVYSIIITGHYSYAEWDVYLCPLYSRSHNICIC